MSKARFVAAQFEGYFAGRRLARDRRHANAMAARLAAGITKSNAARLAWESEANEVFPVLPKDDDCPAAGGRRDVLRMARRAVEMRPTKSWCGW